MEKLKEGADWLEIHDDEVTAVSLIAQIEERVQKRRGEHGRIAPQFPTFGYIAAMPKPPTPQSAPNLYYHLRQLNERDDPETTAVLIPSPATRTPIIGRFWRLIRGQMHNLILFYVNRANAHSSQTNQHLTSIVNELTRLTQEQQRQIEQMQTEIDALKNKQ